MSLEELTTQVELGVYLNTSYLSEEARKMKLQYYPTPSTYAHHRGIYQSISLEDIYYLAKKEGEILYD